MVQGKGSKELEFIPPKKRKENKKDSHIKKTNVDHVKVQVGILHDWVNIRIDSSKNYSILFVVSF